MTGTRARKSPDEIPRVPGPTVLFPAFALVDDFVSLLRQLIVETCWVGIILPLGVPFSERHFSRRLWRRRMPGRILVRMKFISLRSVFHALKERHFWTFCAAMATDAPVAAGPNLRLL